MATSSLQAMDNKLPPGVRKNMAESDDLQDALKQIEDALQEEQSRPGGPRKWVVDGLRSSWDEYKAKLVGSGAVAQGQNAIAAGERAVVFRQGNGNFINTGNVQGNVYFGKAGRNAVEDLAIYRSVLAQTTATLQLHGLSPAASGPDAFQKPMDLAKIYIGLDTESLVKESEHGHIVNRIETTEPLLREETRKMTALEALIFNRRIVLLGDPGGGKSTFVRFITYCLAMHSLDPRAGWLERLSGWNAEEAEILPVVLILRDYAASLPKELPAKAEAAHLCGFLKARLDAQHLAFAFGPIEEALENGNALVMLDGLDEVTMVEQRVFIRDAVQAFMERFPGNRYLITCRFLSYLPPIKGKPDFRLTKVAEFRLAPFDDKKIDAFIECWYYEMGLPEKIEKLKVAVRQTDIQVLASNPMLLTVMAMVHVFSGELPNERVKLFEEVIDLLLFRWEAQKPGGGEDKQNLKTLLREAGRNEDDLKRVISELAFQAHARTGRQKDKLADISFESLLKGLAGLVGSYDQAQRVIDIMQERAGLLLEREPGVFTFPHRTFQEYMAGTYLVQKRENFIPNALELTDEGDAWQQVILLAAGYADHVRHEPEKPLLLANELCPIQMRDSERAWRRVWLAGDILLEIGQKRVQTSELGKDLLERIRNRLAQLLYEGRLSSVERVRAGDTLARLGDLRFREDFWFLLDESLLGFVEIPAGEFLMGSDPEKDGISEEDEEPQYTAYLPTYYIARYPVTVGQFRSFIEDSGYKPSDFNCLNDIPTHPVRLITWYDALDYCHWLTGKLVGHKNLPLKLRELFCTGWQVSLPSEAEWEKAARGSGGNIFPWSNKFEENKANTLEASIGDTSTVGCFPAGISTYGISEMAGNVWEWTRSSYQKYPLALSEDRLEQGNKWQIEKNGAVLRGGSFSVISKFARCAYRGKDLPDYRYHGVGFRIVLSPFCPK
jgi:formylglycine-generating enzyme required for sulfatase activity